MSDNPSLRLSEVELEDVQVSLPVVVQPDTKLAFEQNFPAEQLQPWAVVAESLKHGWMMLHELRSKSSGELLSARLMVYYGAQKRGELPFILVAWVVTPDNTGSMAKQGKGRGYGSYLRERSFAITKHQKPHVLGLVAERESPRYAISQEDQRVKRARWMSRIGLFAVAGLDYEIPPFMTREERTAPDYVVVSEREKQPRPADLLITRFDNQLQLEGKLLLSVVERIYRMGYGIQADDPYLAKRLSIIDAQKIYDLVNA